MVVPFGFGIGDVIALAKLVTNVISAIKQARGVSGESEQIISRLSSLHSALETVASALETRQHMMQSMGLVSQINNCQKLLRDFCEASGLDWTSASRFRKARTALHWTYVGPQRLARLQESLAPHIKGLECLVDVAIIQDGQIQQSQLAKVTAQNEQIRAQLSAVISAVVYDIPRTLGHFFSGGVPSDHVRMLDGLGQDWVVPIGLCRSADTIAEVLEVKFRHTPGYSRVKRRNYLLMDYNHRAISHYSWSTRVGPGVTLYMSMRVICWRRSVVDSCPSCKSEGQIGLGKWHTCFSCRREYTVNGAAEFDEALLAANWWDNDPAAGNKHTWTRVSPEHQRHAETRMETATLTKAGPISGVAMEPDDHLVEWSNEESHFRRMHIVWQPIFVYVWRSGSCRCADDKRSNSKRSSGLDAAPVPLCPFHFNARAKPDVSQSFGHRIMHVQLPPNENDPVHDHYGHVTGFKLWLWRGLGHDETWSLIDLKSLLPPEALKEKYHIATNETIEIRARLVEWREEDILQGIEELKGICESWNEI